MTGIFGRVWSVGIYPPFGGISVYLWGLGVALLLTAACLTATCLNARRVTDVIGDYAPLLPILVVSSLLSIWAAAVYLFTDTLALTRLLTFALGIGLVGVSGLRSIVPSG